MSADTFYTSSKDHPYVATCDVWGCAWRSVWHPTPLAAYAAFRGHKENNHRSDDGHRN